MISLAYARPRALYNGCKNERSYECCARLGDAERKKDMGAFFKSIHGTLNHLLLGDRVWMGRFLGRPFAVTSLAQELYADFAKLREERGATDAEILQWVDTLSEERLARDLTYMSIVNPTQRSQPLWFTV